MSHKKENKVALRLLAQSAATLKELNETTLTNDTTTSKDGFDNIGFGLMDETSIRSLPVAEDVLSAFALYANEQKKVASQSPKPPITMSDIGLMGPAIVRNAGDESGNVKMSLCTSFFDLSGTSDQEVLQQLAAAMPETFGKASPIPAPFICQATDQWMCFPADDSIGAFAIVALTSGTITCLASDIETGDAWRHLTKRFTSGNGFLLEKALTKTLDAATHGTFGSLDFKPGNVLIFRTGACIKLTATEKEFCCKVVTFEEADSETLQSRANALKRAKENGYYVAGELGLDQSVRRIPVTTDTLGITKPAPNKIALLKEEARVLLEQAALLPRAVWNGTKEATIRSKLDASEDEKKLARQLRGAIDTLAKNIDSAKEEATAVLPGILESLTTIGSQLDLIKPHEEVMKTDMKGHYKSYAASLTKYTGWQEPDNYLMNQLTNIAHVRATLEKLVPLVLEGLKSGKGTKRGRAAVTVPIVDPDSFEPVSVTNGPGLEAWMTSFAGKLSSFATMIQSMGDLAASDILNAAKKGVDAKKEDYYAMFAGLRDDEPELYNVTIPNGYIVILDQMLASMRGSVESSDSPSGSEPAKQVKCKECKKRRNDCRDSGKCAQCYSEDASVKMQDNVERKVLAAQKIMSKKVLAQLLVAEDGSPLMDILYELSDKIADSAPNTVLSFLESFEKCCQQILAKLPADLQVEDSFIEDDEDDEDDDEEEGEEEADKGLFKKLPNDYEEDVESFDSSDSEQEAPKKKAKSQVPGSGLAEKTLAVCIALPVLSIRNELLMLYADEGKHTALNIRLDHYKSTVEKIFGVLVRDKVDPNLDPFEHDTFFVDQRDAIEARNKYNLLPNYKAEIITRQIAW